MAVTIYTSDDAGAPVLDGTNGSLINLLDKCLVTGYGSKSAVGWSKPFADTQLSVDPYWSNVIFQMKMDRPLTAQAPMLVVSSNTGAQDQELTSLDI